MVGKCCILTGFETLAMSVYKTRGVLTGDIPKSTELAGRNAYMPAVLCVVCCTVSSVGSNFNRGG